MFVQVIGIFAAGIFIIFGLKHVWGLRKVENYLKKSKHECSNEHESSLIKISTSGSIRNKVAYDYVWGQRYLEHNDKDFVLLCSKTFRSGIYSILFFVIVIVCM